MWRSVLTRNLLSLCSCVLIVQTLWPSAAAADAWGGIRLFEAELSAANQTTVTDSAGVGFTKLRFDIPTMTITWEVDFDGLTSAPTGIHLHGPAQPGTNAVAIIDLGSNGLQSPISGTVKVTDAHAQYMLLGWTYVLLKTRRYPDGELRGKLDTVPPPGFVRDLATGKGTGPAASAAGPGAATENGEQKK